MSVVRPVLRAERVRLDPLTEAHVEELVELDSDPEVLHHVFGRALTRREVVEDFLPRRTRLVGAAQIATTLLFTVLATMAAPAAWADPFGPLLKNIAVLAATLALMATED